MMAAVAANKGFRSCKTSPGRTPNGLNSIHGPKTEKSDATLRQFLDVILFQRFPLTPDEFGLETSAIGSVLKLSFHPYQVSPNPSPYATVAPILVQTALGLRNRLEVNFNWASNLGWTPLLAS